MVFFFAFWPPKKLGRWQEPANGTFSLKKYRLTAGVTQRSWRHSNSYLLQLNSFELLALRGGGITKTCAFAPTYALLP